MDQEQADALHAALIERYPDPAERAEAMAFEALVIARESNEALQQFSNMAQVVASHGVPGLISMMRGAQAPKESRRERKARERAEAEAAGEEPAPDLEPQGLTTAPGELHVTHQDEHGIYRCEADGCDFAQDGPRWADAHEATGSVEFDTLVAWIEQNPEVEVPGGD